MRQPAHTALQSPSDTPAAAVGGRNRPPRGRLLAIAAAGLVALVAAAALVLMLPGATEVVDRGHDLRPYSSGVVEKVRVADAVTVYIDEESSFVGLDVFSGAALVALATAAAITALLLSLAGAPGRLRRFYAIAAFGLAFVALDELTGLHETVGHNLLFLTDLPGVERPDDVVFAAYLVPAVVVAIVFRDVLTSSPLALRLFVAAFGLFVLAAVMDVAGVKLDEPLEVLVSLTVAAAMVVLMAQHLGEHLRLSELRAAASAAPAGDRPASPR